MLPNCHGQTKADASVDVWFQTKKRVGISDKVHIVDGVKYVISNNAKF